VVVQIYDVHITCRPLVLASVRLSPFVPLSRIVAKSDVLLRVTASRSTRTYPFFPSTDCRVHTSYSAVLDLFDVCPPNSASGAHTPNRHIHTSTALYFTSGHAGSGKSAQPDASAHRARFLFLPIPLLQTHCDLTTLESHIRSPLPRALRSISTPAAQRQDGRRRGEGCARDGR
jgi:hypothetical protein